MFAISSYNSYLSETGKHMNFKEYVDQINKMSNSNINLKMFELEKYNNRNECCIPHSLLYTFNILKTNKGCMEINDVKKILFRTS